MSALALLLALAAPLADLRVGESDGIARIVLVCTEPCAAEPADDGFLIEGVRDELAYEARDSAAGLKGFTLEAEGEATRLTLRTARPPAGVIVTACEPEALCFDVDLRSPGGGVTSEIESMERRLEVLARRRPVPASAAMTARIEAAAGRVPTARECGEAEETLEGDGWALEAYRTLALCRAAAGQTREAAAMFARLAAVSDQEEDRALSELLGARSTPLR